MDIHPYMPVSFDQVTLTGGFWKRWQDVVRQVTLPACMDKCEATQRLDNFSRAAGRQSGGFVGLYFNDSDVYKVLEGVAYILHQHPDGALSGRADRWIDDICAAQWTDGYLNTYYTLTAPDKRWTDMARHEAYCLSNLAEAGIAMRLANGDDRLLHAAGRAIRQMHAATMAVDRPWVTGHQGLELALAKMARYTGDAFYLDFAGWLLRQRGHGHYESTHVVGEDRAFYCQDDVPVHALRHVTGHAVRAMYYYSGMTDYAMLTGDTDMLAVLQGLWNHLVPANTYATGGIGQSKRNEGFTRDWHLPNLTAYCETCASIGFVFWNHRMSLANGAAKHADMLERTLYNALLAGLSLQGDSFFYDNPLSSVGLYRRSPWFDCSCCPTNLVRFLPSLGGDIYAHRGNGLVIDQYIENDAAFAMDAGMASLSVRTGYPWAGDISISVLQCPRGTVLYLRIPRWCTAWRLACNGQALQAAVVEGYARVPVQGGDHIILSMDMPVCKMERYQQVQETAGRIAFSRGPLVYCAEEIDQPGIPPEYFPAELEADSTAAFTASWSPEDLGGITRLTSKSLCLVPYYAWGNRGPGGMAVWLKEKAGLAMRG